MKKVAVFGAGVAGLTVAHEFVRLGYKVVVYEANKESGGFFRSARTSGDHMPSEYSWHGIGPWYHNVFDIMKQIPFDATGSMYDKGLSRPVPFAVAPDEVRSDCDNSYLFDKPKSFRMTWWDRIMLRWLLLKTWTANRRSSERYARLNAYEQWKPVMSDRGAKTWRSIFGPWVGSDWTNVSLHQVGQFFRKCIMSGPSYKHKADEQGPAWEHGGGDCWLLLRAPSNECWFDRWVAYLSQKGVEFFWQESLKSFDFDGANITAAYFQSGTVVRADVYVLAVNPFAAAEILRQTPELAKLDELRLFEPLIQDGPHTQVSFRIGFAEKIVWPVERTAVIAADSEFNITLFAQEQVWRSDVDLGDGIASLWTGTACVAREPGRVHGLPLIQCTKEQFIEEVLTQLRDCQGLDFLIKQANGGRGFATFPIVKIEVWHEWLFGPDGIKPRQPKWVNTTNTQPYLPSQKTSVSNLVLAGAHTKTTTDLWSIEAAVESGRLAVKVIEPAVNVIPQYKALPLRMISAVDDICFAIGAPHILDIAVVGCVAAVVIFMVLMLIHR